VRSTASRTATVCVAPVAAPKPSHYAVGLSPDLRPFLPCCGWSSADTAALHRLADRDCVRSTSRCAQAISLRRGTIPWPSPFPTVLRLVLGGHSRAPQPYGPRLCAQHQSLRSGHLTTPWGYSLAFALSYRAAAGPRRTQPRSTDSRTATVCAAPVAAPKPSHCAVGLSPGLRLFLPCCGWSSADTAALHSLTDRDCVQSTSRYAQAMSLRRGTIAVAFAFSYRAAAGPRRTQPRSTDSRTQPTGPAESMQPNFPGGVLTRELIYSGQ
jgi:hypothetical protein